MRKTLVAVFAVAVGGFAGPSAAGIVDLVLSPTGPDTFSMVATADMPFNFVGFGIRGNSPSSPFAHTFTPNTTNLPAGSTIVSTAPDFSTAPDGSTNYQRTNLDNLQPASTPIPVGTLQIAGLVAEGPYDADAAYQGSQRIFINPKAFSGLGSGDSLSTGGPFEFQTRITIIPEPTSILLLGASLAGLAFLRPRPH